MSNVVPRPRKGDRPDRPTRWSLTWRATRPDGTSQRLYETFSGTMMAGAKGREHRRGSSRSMTVVPSPKFVPVLTQRAYERMLIIRSVQVLPRSGSRTIALASSWRSAG